MVGAAAVRFLPPWPSKAGLWFRSRNADPQRAIGTWGVRPRLRVRVTEAVPEPGRLLLALQL